MVIMDPVHGAHRLDPLQIELVQTPEVQRLNFIHQLGMSFHVYPSAHGMRFAHALGVSMTARRMGEHLLLGDGALDLPPEEAHRQVRTLAAAGLLHDVCHTPWSHTLEPLYIKKFGGSHMDMVRDVLTGARPMDLPGAGRIPEILVRHGVDPELTADLINKQCDSHPYLQQIIFGEVDADTLDYLKRDFYHTGVSFGLIDIGRLISTTTIHEGRLVFRSKGLQAVRNFLNARVEMYSTVYLHKTTRIADLMLLRAAEASILGEGEFPDFPYMTDDELLSLLHQQSRSEYARDLAYRVKYRQNLFKVAHQVDAASDRAATRRILAALSELARGATEIRQRLEHTLTERTGVGPGYLLVDLPKLSTEVSEERFRELDIRFLTGSGRILSLQELDPPFAEYIGRASPSRAILAVYCDQSDRQRVREETKRYLQEIQEPLLKGLS